MTDSSQLQVRRLMPADARLFKEIRLEALQQAPEAFGSTFEQECSQSLAQFEAVLTKADVFGAFRDADLLGMPLRLTVGAKGLKDGVVEMRDRRTKEVVKVKPEGVVKALEDRIMLGIDR